MTKCPELIHVITYPAFKVHGVLHIREKNLPHSGQSPIAIIAQTKAKRKRKKEKRKKEQKGQNIELAFSPKRAMVELRHSSSIGGRTSSSPMKRDDVSSPLFPDSQPNDDDHDRHASKDRDRPSWYNFQSLCPFFSDDARVSPYNSRISLFFIFVIVLVGAISVFSILNRLVSTLIP
jgi:hypothetical protein